MFRLVTILIIVISLSFSDIIKINDFTGGINTKTSPEKIANNQSTDITNLNFATRGSIKTRDGMSYTYISTEDINTDIRNTSMNRVQLGFSSIDEKIIITSDISNLSYLPFLSDLPYNYSYPIVDLSKVLNKYNSSTIKHAYLDVNGVFVSIVSFNFIDYDISVYSSTADLQLALENYRSNIYSKYERIITTEVYSYIELIVVTKTIETIVNGVTVSVEYQDRETVTKYSTRNINVYRFDLTNIFKKMIETGHYCMTIATQDAKASWQTFGLESNNLNIDIYDDLINIDDKESNLYINSGYVKYGDKTLNESYKNYANARDNIYLFNNGKQKTYNNYIKDFSNIGYFSPDGQIVSFLLPISGNLTGTYNYAHTNIYDGVYESNPVLIKNIITNNYYGGKIIGEISGYKYFIYNNNNSYFIQKNSTANKVIVNKFLFDKTYSIHKAIFTSQNLYFSTDEDIIYKVNLSDLNIDATYTGAKQFAIFNNYIYVIGGGNVNNNGVVNNNTFFYSSFGNYGEPGYLNIYFKKLDYNLNKVGETLLDRVYSLIPQDVNILDTSMMKCYDLSSDSTDVYMSLYLGRFFGDNCLLKAEANTAVNGSIKIITSSFVMDNSKGVCSSGNASFYNNNGQLISWVSTNVRNILVHEAISSSDKIMGFSSGVVEQEYSSGLDKILTSNSSYYQEKEFNISNGQFLLNVPTSNNKRVTGRNIYRQKNSSGFYYLTSILNNTTTTFNDNISDIQQSVIPLDYNNNIPDGSIDATYSSARMFYLTSKGRIVYSKINLLEAVPSNNYINIKTDSDDKPQRIISFYSGLVVFFSKSIWYIDLSNSEPIYWVPRPLNVDFGCPYPFSITKGKLLNQSIGLFYLAEDKSIRVLNGTGKQDIQLFDNIYTDKMSTPIEDDLAVIIDGVEDIYMTYFNYKLYLNIPSLSRIYVWDSALNAFTKYTTPEQFKYIGVVDNNLVAGNYNSSTMYKLEDKTATRDLSLYPINWNYSSKIFADDYELFKDYDTIYVRGKHSNGGKVNVSIINNGDSNVNINTMNVVLTGNASIVTNRRKIVSSFGRDLKLGLSGSIPTEINDISIGYSIRKE